MRVKDDPAARLRVLMAERDLNVQELADITGLSRVTISRLRTGWVERPTYDTARLIADALGVKLNNIWPDY
ncbi:helix-turn-helix domain-containing protein [Alicyclobacillus fastidiosus]|uniref:Helix-turn-helix transcriptional regulator n=1 Tax=Alicyclobacillus fastidiosus TaxID=392011 RepID=A0ABV5ALC5_9BACL